MEMCYYKIAIVKLTVHYTVSKNQSCDAAESKTEEETDDEEYRRSQQHTSRPERSQSIEYLYSCRYSNYCSSWCKVDPCIDVETNHEHMMSSNYATQDDDDEQGENHRVPSEYMNQRRTRENLAYYTKRGEYKDINFGMAKKSE